MAKLRGPSILGYKHDRNRFTCVRREAAEDALVEQNRCLDVRVLAAPRSADERKFTERPRRILAPASTLSPDLELRGAERTPIKRLEQRELICARGKGQILPIRHEDLDGWRGRPGRLCPHAPFRLTLEGDLSHAFGTGAPLRLLRRRRLPAALVAHPMISAKLVSVFSLRPFHTVCIGPSPR